VVLGRGPLGLVNTIKKLLERNSSESGLENLDYGRRGSATLTTRHQQKLVLTSLTSGGRSVGIARSRTQDKEIIFLISWSSLWPLSF
jgi:hypothetical protein